MINEFSKKYLFEALVAAGLPASRSTVLKYEKDGVISKPAIQRRSGNQVWSFYTQKEIDICIARIRKHVAARKR